MSNDMKNKTCLFFEPCYPQKQQVHFGAADDGKQEVHRQRNPRDMMIE